MNNESDLFKSYFKAITLLEGGAETGFRHVKPEEYKPRLLHFHGTRKNIVINERPLYKKCLDSGDVFILDLGLEIYQWNGKTANKDEKFKAMQQLQEIKSERGGKPNVETLEERDISASHKFYSHLADGEPEADDENEKEDTEFKASIFRLSDESGKLSFSLVSEGKLSMDFLDPKDVFIVDTGKKCFVWIGGGASEKETKNAMTYAHNYLMKTKHPLVPVSCLKAGAKNEEFKKLMTA
jgi:gelsolin